MARCTMLSTCVASGKYTSTSVWYVFRTRSINSYVSCGSRPVSMVNRRTAGLIRQAMSRITMPLA